jgi:PAS domain S-box-containing protein
MSEHLDLAKTMRIDLRADERDKADSALVSMRTADDRAGATSFAHQARHDAADIHASEYVRLLQSIYDAVLITDCYGKIVDFNHRSLDFFRYGEADLQAMSVSKLIAGIDEHIMGSIRRNLIERRYTLIEGNCVRRDQSTFPSEVAVNRLDFDPQGRLCFFVRDISVRKRAQEALEEAVTRLEAHDRARSQFVSNVSHELRTPLTSMIYAVNNMLRGVVGTMTERQQSYLEMLQGDCRRLLATVNDILDMRKLESQQLTLARTCVPFGLLVDRTAESMRVQAEQKRQTLTIEARGGTWFVDCDTQKMERVLLNVIGNAVKFTGDGGAIRVALSDDTERIGHVRLTVTDTGIGIPVEALPRVTERYFTVGEQPSGSGLGLAISREIVELHDGHFAIHSPVPGRDDGTQVDISLSLADPPLVLVVDDDAAVAASLRDQIEACGYRVAVSACGEDAYTAIKTETPDVIVLDLVLPDMDGTELIMRLKTEGALARIPIIAVTGAHVGRAKAGILRNFGIPALGKPWETEALIEKVEGAFFGRTPFMLR